VIPQESLRKLRGALWWLGKSHIVNYAKHQHSPGGGTTFAERRHDVSNYIPPIVRWKFYENPFSRSRERLSHSFGGRKENICKTYTHPPPTERRLRKKAIVWLHLRHARATPPPSAFLPVAHWLLQPVARCELTIEHTTNTPTCQPTYKHDGRIAIPAGGVKKVNSAPCSRKSERPKQQLKWEHPILIIMFQCRIPTRTAEQQHIWDEVADVIPAFTLIHLRKRQWQNLQKYYKKLSYCSETVRPKACQG